MMVSARGLASPPSWSYHSSNSYWEQKIVVDFYVCDVRVQRYRVVRIRMVLIITTHPKLELPDWRICLFPDFKFVYIINRLHPQPYLPVITWWDAFHLLKHTGKVMNSAHAAFDSNRFHGFICEAKELFGMGNSNGSKSIVGVGF